MLKTTSSTLDSTSLICGIAVPLAYFGIQLAAAPFYPGYRFLADDASTLGSPGSTFPALFNLGSLVVGLLLVGCVPGIARSLFRVQARRWVTCGVIVALLAGATGCLNAGVFPLPDERHTSGPLASVGMLFFLLPFLLPFLFAPRVEHARIRTYFWLNLVILLGLVPIVSGLIQRLQGALGIELPGYQDFLNDGFGVLQRVTAAVVFVPIGVLSWHLLRSDRRPAA